MYLCGKAKAAGSGIAPNGRSGRHGAPASRFSIAGASPNRAMWNVSLRSHTLMHAPSDEQVSPPKKLVRAWRAHARRISRPA
jgi:hypothetical protein